MGKMKFCVPILFCALASCSSAAFDDKYYQYDDVPNRELRGDTLEHDRPITDCVPIPNADGTKQFKCVVHFYADYDALLKKITDLENELVACQQGHHE